MGRTKKTEETELETKAPESAPEVAGTEDFVLSSPTIIKPVDRPFVVTLPETASSAQKEYAKLINQYAYQSPEKYEKKKAVMLKRLKALAGMEVVIPDGGLEINKSKVSFAFNRDSQGNELPLGA